MPWLNLHRKAELTLVFAWASVSQNGSEGDVHGISSTVLAEKPKRQKSCSRAEERAARCAGYSERVLFGQLNHRSWGMLNQAWACFIGSCSPRNEGFAKAPQGDVWVFQSSLCTTESRVLWGRWQRVWPSCICKARRIWWGLYNILIIAMMIWWSWWSQCNTVNLGCLIGVILVCFGIKAPVFLMPLRVGSEELSLVSSYFHFLS